MAHAQSPASRLRPDVAQRQRAANLRTALVLAAIALVFFGGVIVAKFMGGWTVGMSIVGGGVLIFLVFAIGRNLRRER